MALVRALLCGDPVHTRPSLLDASRRQALLLLRVWGVTGLQPVLGAGAALHCSAWLWGAVLPWFQTGNLVFHLIVALWCSRDL